MYDSDIIPDQPYASTVLFEKLTQLFKGFLFFRVHECVIARRKFGLACYLGSPFCWIVPFLISNAWFNRF